MLFDVALAMPAETALYGEGFQMLSQTGGTLGRRSISASTPTRSITAFRKPDSARAFYGLLTLTPPGRDTTLSRSRRARVSADVSSAAEPRLRR